MHAFALPGSAFELAIWFGVLIGVVFLGFGALAFRWFVRAIAGKNEERPANRFEDGPRIVSEED